VLLVITILLVVPLALIGALVVSLTLVSLPRLIVPVAVVIAVSLLVVTFLESFIDVVSRALSGRRPVVRIGSSNPSLIWIVLILVYDLPSNRHILIVWTLLRNVLVVPLALVGALIVPLTLISLSRWISPVVIVVSLLGVTFISLLRRFVGFKSILCFLSVGSTTFISRLLANC
jgi:hypothetical protein